MSNVDEGGLEPCPITPENPPTQEFPDNTVEDSNNSTVENSYIPYNAPRQDRAVSVAFQIGNTSITVNNRPNTLSPFLPLVIVGGVFLIIGVVFVFIATFVTNWTSMVNGVPVESAQASEVARLVFGILGGVFTLVGAICSKLAIRSWRRRRQYC